MHARSRFQIILTTPNAPIAIHYPKIHMSNKSHKFKKKISIKKHTQEKTTCKLVEAQASTFCIILNSIVFPILNNCSKRKVLQSEELMTKHANDKL